LEKTFDSYNPVQAKECVRRYRLFLSLDNLNYVMVDLDFERLSKANTFVEAMQQLWEQFEGKPPPSSRCRGFRK
jgi:hypothetical protein